jgi:transcriptional regulator with XRE-family HTH domain
MIGRQRFSMMVGTVLREHRLACGYTLHDVSTKSRGLVKASALASYERAERKITLERFVYLMSLYDTPADRALGEVMARMFPRSRRKFTFDVDKLRTLDGHARDLLDFIHRVRVARGDYFTGMISLRSGDIETVASESGATPNDLLTTMRVALVTDCSRDGENGQGNSEKAAAWVSLFTPEYLQGNERA